MENYTNAGYQIILAVPLDATHALAIGRNPSAAAEYVCWDCTLIGRRYIFENGGYSQTYRQALHIVADRIRSRYDWISRTFTESFEGHFTGYPLPLREEV